MAAGRNQYWCRWKMSWHESVAGRRRGAPAGAQGLHGESQGSCAQGDRVRTTHFVVYTYPSWTFILLQMGWSMYDFRGTVCVWWKCPGRKFCGKRGLPCWPGKLGGECTGWRGASLGESENPVTIILSLTQGMKLSSHFTNLVFHLSEMLLWLVKLRLSKNRMVLVRSLSSAPDAT